jgi:uncharacterized protein DUF4332
MSRRLDTLRGCSWLHADMRAALVRSGYSTIDEALPHLRTARQQELFARQQGLLEDQVAFWLRVSELTRVHGIGPKTAARLQATSFDCLRSLQDARPEELRSDLLTVLQSSGFPATVPGKRQVSSWIDSSRHQVPVLERRLPDIIPELEKPSGGRAAAPGRVGHVLWAIVGITVVGVLLILDARVRSSIETP